MSGYQKEAPKKKEEPTTTLAEVLSENWDKAVEAKKSEEDDEQDERKDAGQDEDGSGSAGTGEGDEEGSREGDEEGSEEEVKTPEKDEEGDDEEEEGDDDDKEVVKTIPVSAPESWPEEAKKDFETLPPRSRDFIVNTYKGMQADYTRKLQGIQGVVSALGPIHQECVENGITYDEAIRRFVGIHERMKKDPVKTIVEVGALYGVDLSGAVPRKSEEEDIPPALASRIQKLENEVSTTRNAAVQQTAAQLAQQVEEFKKTAPFYDEVEQAMVSIVNLHNARGVPSPPLQKLYEDACWLVPTVREKLIAQKAGGTLKESVDERKDSVAKAKKASKSIKRRSKESVEKLNATASTKDVLNAVWDEVAGAAAK